MIETILKPVLILIFSSIISRLSYDGLRLILEKIVGVDEFIEKKRLKEAIFNINVSKSLAFLISLYIFLIFFKKSLEIINFFTNYAGLVVRYYPYIIYIFFLFIFSALLSEVAKKFVENNLHIFPEQASSIAKYLAFFVIFYIGLDSIGIRIEIINFTIKAIIVSILFSISLAFGIGFGLALSEKIKRWK